MRGIDHIAEAANRLLGLAREEDAGAHHRVRAVVARRTQVEEAVKVANGRADGDVRAGIEGGRGTMRRNGAVMESARDIEKQRIQI